MEKKHKIFVYGTLREEQEATHLLPYYMMLAYQGKDFSFPYIVEHPDRDVVGNVIEVDDKELDKLDIYENIRSGLYVRVEVEVLRIDNVDESDLVWVYIAGPSLFNVIENGDWLEFLKEN